MSSIRKSLILMFLLQTMETKPMCLAKAYGEIQKAYGEFRLTKRHVMLGLVIAFCYMWHRSVRRQMEREEAYRRDWTDPERRLTALYNAGYQGLYLQGTQDRATTTLQPAQEPRDAFNSGAHCFAESPALQTVEQIRRANLKTSLMIAEAQRSMHKLQNPSGAAPINVAQTRAELNRLKTERALAIHHMARGKKKSPALAVWTSQLKRISELEAVVSAAT